MVYGWVGQRFTLRDACENGDGTVPLRAGQIVHENIRERLAVQVLHEAAYRDTLSQAFALRSIIKLPSRSIMIKKWFLLNGPHRLRNGLLLTTVIFITGWLAFKPKRVSVFIK